VELGPSEYRTVQGAWIHVSAKLPEDPGAVVIEPGALIGPDVELGHGTWVGSGAVIYGPTRLGEKNQVWPNAVLGGAPQDLGYANQPTRLEIGNRNVFREGVTVHRASTKKDGVTRIGDDNYFMANSHVGHDCVVENRVILANGVLLGGHCVVQSSANIAGLVAVHQFVTVGRNAFICGTCGVRKDMEPFIAHDKKGSGEAFPTCINEVGLRRAGFSRETIGRLRTAYKIIFLRATPIGSSMDKVWAEAEARGALCPEVEELLAFVGRKRASRFGRALN